MIEQILFEMNKSLDNECYLSALAMALVLPDICGEAEYPNELPEPRYIKWLDKYVVPFERFQNKNNDVEMLELTSSIIYKLRNSIMHDGSPEISLKKKQRKTDKFELVIDEKNELNLYADSSAVEYHETDENKKITSRNYKISVRRLCLILSKTAESYYKENKSKFVNNNTTFIDNRTFSKEKDTNIKVFNMALEYLHEIKPDNVYLENYFMGDRREFNSLRDVFIQFIQSAQNYQRMPKVIQFKEKIETISHILYNFDYEKVKSINAVDLYRIFRKEFNITSKDNKQNSWYKWSKSIVDSAAFISGFKDVDDFKTFVKLYDYNTTTRMSLPLLISTKISGIGFALACDLLKELGFTEYPKPDVHLMDVFSALRLSDNEQISNFEAIVKMARDNNVTPYKVDKVFWLICSGRFYLEEKEIKVGQHKKEFIEYMEHNSVYWRGY